MTGMPTLLDRYRLRRLIGSGGMSEVWAGVDERLGREVAVKLARPAAARDPRLGRLLAEEARIAAVLAHPRVVAVYDTGETDDGRPFVVMELLNGRSLADRLRSGPLDADALDALAIDLLDALAAAHDRGIVHGDVKPGNLLADRSRWKLADFGAASRTDVALPPGGAVIGTRPYLAPERLAGSPATPAADVYAAGVVLAEAATGAAVEADTVGGAVRSSRLPGLGAAVALALEADPSRRPPDARALRALARERGPRLVGVGGAAGAGSAAAAAAGAEVGAGALHMDPGDAATTVVPRTLPATTVFEEDAPATTVLPAAAAAVAVSAPLRHPLARWVAAAGLLAALALGALLAVGHSPRPRPARADLPAPPTTVAAPTTTVTSSPAAAPEHRHGDHPHGAGGGDGGDGG